MKLSSPYWSFYWPLALNSVITLLAQQLQNAALARYPEAVYELATFAMAASTFHLFDAVLVFMPQLVNVLGRSRESARLCLQFTLRVCAVMTAFVLILAFPPLGNLLMGRLFHIEGAQLQTVLRYLLLLSPNIVLVGLRHYYVGLLVRAERTGLVTVLNALYLGVILLILIVGRLLEGNPVLTLGIAQVTASAVAAFLLWNRFRRLPEADLWRQQAPLTHRAIFDFFWPVALTSLMFSLTRPILYVFLGRLDDSNEVIAAMRVGFDLAIIFHNVLNQFRHLFATFGREDLAGLRQFLRRVTAVVVLLMVVWVFSPLCRYTLRYGIGLEGRVLEMSRQMLMVLCLLPAMIAWRNFHHGVAIIRRRTGPMGAGGVARNLTTAFLSWLLLSLGGLNHLTGAAVLVSGFLTETLIVIYWRPFKAHALALWEMLAWPWAGDDQEEA